MSSDVILEDNTVRITEAALKIEGPDLCIDVAGRRSAKNTSRPRRALVHDFNDGLTVNWDHDYPAGVAIRGPASIDRGLVIEGEILHVARKSPPAPDGIPVADPKVNQETLQAAETRRKRQAVAALGGSPEDYVITVVDISGLLTRVAKLEEEVQRLRQKVGG